jgi:hypothetical protein
MSDIWELAARTALIGSGATLATDLWARLLKYGFGVPSPDWRMVGRWLGHMPGGRFAHRSMAQAAPVRGEHAIGWIAHYAIGIIYAAMLVAIVGAAWLRQPAPVPALLFGLSTVAFPFLLMQPCMGAGLAASNTSAPNRARLRSVLNHVVFGVGLYAAALLVAWMPG